MVTTIVSTKAVANTADGHAPPNWEWEIAVTERPLWQIAAMAGDVQPKLLNVQARRAVEKAWSKGYWTMIRVMSNALRSDRSPRCIFFDIKKPANSSKIHAQKNLKNVLVDVASATQFLAAKYGTENFPDGLHRLHAAAQARVASDGPLDSPTVRAAPAQAKTPKSQEKANETKTSKALLILLYAVVEAELGWDKKSQHARDMVISKIDGALGKLEIKSKHGLSEDQIEDQIEDYLNNGAEFAPLRVETHST